ncbi:MAG: 50S ribosomal protein L13 [bacterium]|jgi:large subunit ribosomal protein L13|nr:50S ribosomal protein L13 [bacterium]MDD3804657.1 50S ribosomal protein L13 [bacterium]MDD4152593.1 50S ribosomal protein L13 [bacterium]MDD4557474.1 50S ribosomal protein L13 [bacterium]
MRTYSAKPTEINRKWYVVDATDVPLGRLASKVAQVLIGKHKPIFTPNMDTGDHVIVLNAARVRVTGNKAADKMYYRHSQYPGGLKTISFEKLMAKHPERIIELAVKGMLPHNSLGRAMYRKLRVYKDARHGQDAQKPEVMEI